MIKKAVSFIMCFAFAAMLATSSLAREEDRFRESAREIIAHKAEQCGADSAEEWAIELALEAGSGAEWYAISLARLGYGDELGAYAQALAEYLSENKLYGTNAQRAAFAFVAAGCDSVYIDHAAESTVGKQGIMSYIWGLILASTGVECSMEIPVIIDEILSRRLADGGFALSGGTSNPDVTAMALSALAPYAEEAAVSEAVDSALAFLSSAQTENGGFVSYGAENCESAAQVVIALCSLGIDPVSDERFVKNGNSAVDAMYSFGLENGGFCHVHGGGESEIATQQALMAFIALDLLYEGGGRLFDFDASKLSLPEGFLDVDLSGGDKEPSPTLSADKVKDAVCIALISICALGIAAALLIPKKKK